MRLNSKIFANDLGQVTHKHSTILAHILCHTPTLFLLCKTSRTKISVSCSFAPEIIILTSAFSSRKNARI